MVAVSVDFKDVAEAVNFVTDGLALSNILLAVIADAALPAVSVSVTDSVKSPSFKPDKLRLLMVSVAVLIVPVPVTAVPPPLLEMV